MIIEGDPFTPTDSDAFADEVEAWAHLIRTGEVWQLQGSYGRGARALIDNNNISASGVIL